MMGTADMVDVQRILCPIDFSEPSRYAVEHALAAARWYGAQITVVHVHSILVPWGPTPGIHGDVPALPPVRPQDLIKEVDRFYASLRTDGSPDIVVKEGSPAKEIVRLADEMAADLLVMGTHGRGGFDRLVIGSVTEKVFRTARSPVLTVSPGTKSPPGGPVQYKTVLCPVDFSTASTRALLYALSLAKQTAGRMVLLHVVEGVADLPRETAHFNVPEYGAYLEQDAMTRLKAVIPDTARGWCKPEERVTSGKAHREILRLAAETKAELIVMGVHGKGAMERWFGSTTTHVVREATCPVLTVRADSSVSHFSPSPAESAGTL